MQKRSVKLYIVIYVISLLLFHCGIKNPVDDDYNGSGFNIYLLRDESIKFRDINPDDIAPGMLDIKPWLSGDDIDFYDYSSHMIYLNKTFSITGLDPEKEDVFNGRPFVVVVNEEICYVGIFRSIVSSWLSAGCVPLIDTFDFLPDDIIRLHIGEYDLQGTDDPREDKRVLNYLLETGKFRGGLSMNLDRMKVIQGDSASVEYTYSLYNNDKDDLYVLDPERMENGSFHHFTNGVSLNSGSNLYYSTLKTWTSDIFVPYDYVNMDWFSRIESGGTMTRTVVREGYPEIPPGSYKCSFRYDSPYNIQKDMRYMKDGRVWIGKIYSEVKEFIIE